jgi:AcrR family transcriptional regulator
MAIRQRARKAEDKQERRQDILDAAKEQFERGGYGPLTMAQVADGAGIAKGTLYLYFQTKEELLLALLEQELGAWFIELNGQLEHGGGIWSAERVARLICDTILAEPPLAALLSLLQVILEQNIDEDTARHFKAWLGQHMAQTAQLLESRLPSLRQGRGLRALLHINALLVGLYQMSEPAPNVRRVLEDPRFAALRVDFHKEFIAATTALISGAMLGRG